MAHPGVDPTSSHMCTLPVTPKGTKRLRRRDEIFFSRLDQLPVWPGNPSNLYTLLTTLMSHVTKNTSSVFLEEGQQMENRFSGSWKHNNSSCLFVREKECRLLPFLRNTYTNTADVSAADINSRASCGRLPTEIVIPAGVPSRSYHQPPCFYGNFTSSG